MTPRQRENLNLLLQETVRLIEERYTSGAESHSNDPDELLDMSPLQLIEEALEEAADTMVYLLEARRKLIEDGYTSHRVEQCRPEPPLIKFTIPSGTTFMVHGVSCPKVRHDSTDSYMHRKDDDGPYDVDGVNYCGRCHTSLPK